MKTSLVTIRDDAPAYEAASLMRDNNVGSVLVTNASNKIYGIVSERDLVVKVLAANKCGAVVKEVASKPVLTIAADADLSEAARMMGEKNVKRLAVARNGEVIGIISQKDIIRISPSLYDLIAETAKARLKMF
ncbi:MAG: cyclic nucleotide-binding/CBS domain-containing protein [Candidatus Micrarchaeia archaeon]